MLCCVVFGVVFGVAVLWCVVLCCVVAFCCLGLGSIFGRFGSVLGRFFVVFEVSLFDFWSFWVV